MREGCFVFFGGTCGGAATGVGTAVGGAAGALKRSE